MIGPQRKKAEYAFPARSYFYFYFVAKRRVTVTRIKLKTVLRRTNIPILTNVLLNVAFKNLLIQLSTVTRESVQPAAERREMI